MENGDERKTIRIVWSFPVEPHTRHPVRLSLQGSPFEMCHITEWAVQPV